MLAVTRQTMLRKFMMNVFPGGQVLRNSAAYSALLQRPICIRKIRAGRDRGGLRPQHLTGLELIHAIFGGKLENAFVTSTSIVLQPDVPKFAKEYFFEADAQTAGSVALLLQTCLPCLTFLPSKSLVVLKGGTDAIKAPLIDYSILVLQPLLRKFLRMQVDFRTIKRGFYPRGGGVVEVRVEPQREALPALDLVDRGQVTRILCRGVVSGRLALDVAQRMAKTASVHLSKRLPEVPVEIEAFREQKEVSAADGGFLLLVAETSTGCLFGASLLAEKGVTAETIGKDAARELFDELSSGACVDQVKSQLAFKPVLCCWTTVRSDCFDCVLLPCSDSGCRISSSSTWRWRGDTLACWQGR